MLRFIIRNSARLLAAIAVCFAFCWPAAASHLVTGNGFGFAVVAPESGAVTKFYPHPYSFVRADPAKPLSEGIETVNLIKKLGWGGPGPATTIDYVNDTHVIRMRRADGSGTFFMPFGFNRPALVISLEAGPRKAAAWRVEWNQAVRSQKVVGAGPDARLMRFRGIAEPLLLIPLGALRKAPADQPLAASPAWALIALENESEAELAIDEFVRWRARL